MAKVEQDKVDVVVFIHNFMIEGTIYTLTRERLSDFLNTHRQFIPVTGASIYLLPDKKLLDKVEFLDINRNYISAVFPKEERGEATSES